MLYVLMSGPSLSLYRNLKAKAQASLAKMREFVARCENPGAAVNVITDDERSWKKNQKVIECLLKVVMLCWKLLFVGIEMTILILSEELNL